MATIAGPRRDTAGDERFFLVLAFVMAAVLAAGFSLQLAMGRSSFAVPLLYHAHALVFFGWVVLYLTQNLLVASGSVALHRRLGWLAVLWVPAMVALGIALTVHSLRAYGGPPFFQAAEFLIGNPAGVLYFAAMVFLAIGLRRHTAWHRRFMLCGMAVLTGPGFGRLLPTPFLIPWAWWIASFAVPLIFPILGMAADLRRTGRVHPAWWWGVGTLTLLQFAIAALAYSPAGEAITRAVLAGSPGASREFAAHFP